MCNEWQPALEAFNSLAEASGERQCQEWLADALTADEDRIDDVTAMDIYDVNRQPCTCLTVFKVYMADCMQRSTYSEGKGAGVDPGGRRGKRSNERRRKLDLKRSTIGGTKVRSTNARKACTNAT